MSRYQEIKLKIRNKYDSLPKNQKIIADYFIENFDKIPFLSVLEISEATTRSVASIVRFSQRIGFSGYQELKVSIGSELQSHIAKKEIFSLSDEEKIKSDTLTSVANLDINNINETLNLIDRTNFRKTVKMILKAERVFTFGLGISFLQSEILAYQLTQVAVNSYNLLHNQASFQEQILYLNKQDLLIAFSFPPYSKETIDAAKFAKQRGIKVISITNKDSAPINLYTQSQLIVKSDNMLFTNSFAAISVLINALATETAFFNRENAKNMLNEINKIFREEEATE